MPTSQSEVEQQHLDAGQRDVEEPQLPCGRSDALAERGDLGPGELGLHELAAADAKPGSTAIASTMIPSPPSHCVN